MRQTEGLASSDIQDVGQFGNSFELLFITALLLLTALVVKLIAMPQFRSRTVPHSFGEHHQSAVARQDLTQQAILSLSHFRGMGHAPTAEDVGDVFRTYLESLSREERARITADLLLVTAVNALLLSHLSPNLPSTVSLDGVLRLGGPAPRMQNHALFYLGILALGLHTVVDMGGPQDFRREDVPYSWNVIGLNPTFQNLVRQRARILSSSPVVPSIFSPLPDPKSPESRLAAIDFPEDQIPESYKCSISRAVMQFPVKSLEGRHTFERAHILRWLSSSQTSPLTRQPLQESDLTADEELSAEIEAFVVEAEAQYQHKHDRQWGLVPVVQKGP